MQTPEHDPRSDLTPLERRLAAWQPATGALDRDRMLYEAGRAAALVEARGPSQPLTQRLATAALALAAVGLGGLWVHERADRHALEQVLASRMGASESTPAPGPPVPEPLPDWITDGRDSGALSPSSYLVLTARLVQGRGEDPSLAAEVPRDRQTRNVPKPHLAPLRPRDFDRVLEF
jgi:hypothetical protein